MGDSPGMMTRMMARKRALLGLKPKPEKPWGCDYVQLQKGIQKGGKCHKKAEAQKQMKVSMLVMQGNVCTGTNRITTVTAKGGGKCVDA